MKQEVKVRVSVALLPLLVILLLAGFAYAAACEWDLLDDDFDDNSSGFVQTSGSNCDGNENITFEDGLIKINQSYDNSGCVYDISVLGDAAADDDNITMQVRARYMYNTSGVSGPLVNEGFSFSAVGAKLWYTYNSETHNLKASPDVIAFKNETIGNNVWSEWVTFFFRSISIAGGTDYTEIYEGGSLLENVTTATASTADVIRIGGQFGDGELLWGAIEVDFLRVDNSSCDECDTDTDCVYGDYCNNNGFCENTTECNTDDDCFALYGFGYFCNDDERCSAVGSCDTDTDCQTNEYCDTYTLDFYHQCREKLNISDPCTHDNQCFEAECVNETPSVTICDSREPNECWPTGLCELDNTCWYYGVCWNASASNFCTQDSNCTATQYCSVQIENDSFGRCFDKNKLAWDACERDRWCDNETNNTYGEALSCDSNFCTPDSWECNWFGRGCGAGLACNWSVVTEVGDHLCINGSSGRACDDDNNCSSGKCLAGICVDNQTECLYNNPDVFGNSNPNRPLEGYCGSDSTNETNEWCYLDRLNFTWTASEGGGIPTSADSICYPKFDLGWDCDYNYQCFSLSCGFSGNTSTKTCNPIDGSTIRDSTVTVTLDNCELSSNGLGWDCPVDDTAVIFARYRDENGNHIPDANFCRAYSNAFDVSDPFLTEATTAYTAPVSFGVNTNINYSFIVECRKSGFGITFSEFKYIYLTAINTTYVSWIEPLNNTQFESGEAIDFKVKFKDITGAEVGAGSCTLTLDGSDYGMENPYDGIYVARDVIAPTGSGGYAYTVACSKAAFESATSLEQTLTILQGHCFNGYKDEDERGKDCGGSDCPPCGEPPDPDDCFNDEFDTCEWGVDCGGCCEKECAWSDCFNGIQDGMEAGVDCGGFCYMECEDGSCSNGIRDGDEKGVDCGGRCYRMDSVEGACFCDYTNDCNPSDGSWYCDYSVFEVSGVCLESTCDEDGDCLDVQWDYGGFEGNRSRVCDLNSGWCKWGSENHTNGSTADIVMDIQPLSRLPVYNKTYVGSCEGLTHGFSIATNRPTKKAYYFVAHPATNSIPADAILTAYPFKDFDLGRVTNLSLSTIPKLCRSMTGDSIYARIVFKAVEPSTGRFNADVVDIQVYAFMFAANVSLSGTQTNVANFSLTRAGSCFVRADEYSNWTNISASESTTHTYNFSDISTRAFFWMCNTTQGEFDEDSFNAGSVTLLLDLFGGIFAGLTGGTFKWFGWMIVPVFIILVIFVPLLYLAVRDRQNRNNG